MNSGKVKEEEQDGMSVHSPCKPPPSSASSVPKDLAEVELELRLLQAFEIYPPNKLQGAGSMSNLATTKKSRDLASCGLLLIINGHELKDACVMMDARLRDNLITAVYAPFSFDRPFSSEEVLQLLDRFYNVEMLKSDDDEIDILNHEEEFSLPPSFFIKEES
ncbi:hypothetical protein Lal_00020970 [Lupinus albus]|nr:hypothetical protein Lal_00020970 [Lupinus albus]